MIHCPPFSHEVPQHIAVFLDITFYLNLIINPYVIYCIIFRSTVHMKRYRWYLLWHQVACLANDLFFNCLVKPLIFLPFPMGYPIGYLKGVIPSHILAALCISILSVSLSSVSHLFTYRFLVSKGLNHFPIKYVLKLCLRYSIAVILGMGAFWAHEDENKLFAEMKKEYSCFTDELQQIPDFVLFRPKEFALKAIFPAFIAITYLTIDTFITVRGTLQNLNKGPMSERTVQLHKKFLYQLILQIALPLGIILIPIIMVAVSVMTGALGGTTIGLYFTCTVSLFSILGGLILVVMNKSYQTFKAPKNLQFSSSHANVIQVSRNA